MNQFPGFPADFFRFFEELARNKMRMRDPRPDEILVVQQ